MPSVQAIFHLTAGKSYRFCIKKDSEIDLPVLEHNRKVSRHSFNELKPDVGVPAGHRFDQRHCKD